MQPRRTPLGAEALAWSTCSFLVGVAVGTRRAANRTFESSPL